MATITGVVIGRNQRKNSVPSYHQLVQRTVDAAVPPNGEPLLHIVHGLIGQTRADIDTSCEDIAQYVGRATESRIRTLSDFKQEKLISITEGKFPFFKGTG